MYYESTFVKSPVRMSEREGETAAGRRPLVARNERSMETRVLKQTLPVRSVNSNTSLNRDQSIAIHCWERGGERESGQDLWVFFLRWIVNCISLFQRMNRREGKGKYEEKNLTNVFSVLPCTDKTVDRPRVLRTKLPCSQIDIWHQTGVFIDWKTCHSGPKLVKFMDLIHECTIMNWKNWRLHILLQ